MSDETARKLNLLVAYPYARQSEISFITENIERIRMVIDSGAFTAWKLGKPIQLDDYCKFIETLPFKPWRYFTLDVIGDPAATLKNYRTMLDRGFKPVPIFTRGEDPSVIEEYYKTSDVVGIGGLVGTEKNKGFVKGIMRVVGQRRVHLLGFTNLAFLKVFKPYMADSSSWEMGARYASCPLYLGGGQPLVSIRKPTVHAQLKEPRIREAIQRCGIDPDEFLDEDKWKGGYSVTRRIGARSMVRLSLDVAEHLGVKLFLAATTQYACRLLLEGLE